MRVGFDYAWNEAGDGVRVSIRVGEDHAFEAGTDVWLRREGRADPFDRI